MLELMLEIQGRRSAPRCLRCGCEDVCEVADGTRHPDCAGVFRLIATDEVRVAYASARTVFVYDEQANLLEKQPFKPRR
jgi:hypothetical protein